MTSIRTIILAGLWLLLATATWSCARPSTTRATPTPATPKANSSTSLPTQGGAQPVRLPFGNPSNATRDPANADNYLVFHDGYTLSYNNSRGTLNWVSWTTTEQDLGNKRERPFFEPDRTLPDGFRRVQHFDYSSTGYDRGHMVPSADRFANSQRNSETFLMTNIVPQTRGLNEFPWQGLEIYARGLARRGANVYTIAGVYGEKERMKGKIVVPTNCWKVIAVFPRGGMQMDIRTRVIAVDMPNTDGLDNVDWRRYVTTVDAIEEKTGLDIFSELPQDVQAKIESASDPQIYKP